MNKEDIKKINFNDINVLDISLLSVEEAKKLPEKVLKFNGWWWLRSPGDNSKYRAAYVFYDGSVSYDGVIVHTSLGRVRPVLICENLESIKDFEEVEFCGIEWIKISDNMLLCNDNSFGNRTFDSNEDWAWTDTDDICEDFDYDKPLCTYENSEIYKYIHEKWNEILHSYADNDISGDKVIQNYTNNDISAVDNICVQDITLLSKEEAEKLPKDILKFGDWWWLRSPGIYQGRAAAVFSDGPIYYGGIRVNFDGAYIRPALICENLESFKDFEEIKYCGINWIKISDNMLLCNYKTFGYGCFDYNRYWNWNENIYETSNIYKYIHEKWGEIMQNYTNNDNINNDTTNDQVNHPSHYNKGAIECIEAMRIIFGDEKVKAFCELNAFKYLWRAGNKGSAEEDIEKAKWYMNYKCNMESE